MCVKTNLPGRLKHRVKGCIRIDRAAEVERRSAYTGRPMRERFPRNVHNKGNPICVSCAAGSDFLRQNDISVVHSTIGTVVNKVNIYRIRKHSVCYDCLCGGHCNRGAKYNRGCADLPTDKLRPGQRIWYRRFDEGFAVLDYLCIYQLSIVVELILFCMHKIGNGHQAKSTRSIRDHLRQYRQRCYAHQHNERERQRGYFFKPLIHWNSS